MDSAASPRTVAPQPALVRIIGDLHCHFGGLLLLGGLALLALIGRTVIGSKPPRVEPGMTQILFDEMRRQRLDDLRTRERMAGSEDERDHGIARIPIARYARDTSDK
jgi:hypothetical protein